MNVARVVAALLALVALALCDDFDENEKDAYYKWFGLSRRTFDKDALASAYRKKAKQYHPDKNPENKDVFYKIARAFDTLSDDNKRAAYDRGGPSAVDGAGGPQGGADFAHDIFARMFNFGGPFGGARGKPRGPDARMDIEVTLEDIFAGTVKEVPFTRQAVCVHCQGSGADDAPGSVATCTTCRGSGVLVHEQQIMPGFVQRSQGPCPACGGQGRRVAKACPKCRGSRVLASSENLSVRIPAGAPEGHAVVFPGMSEERPGADTGDLAVVLRTKPHGMYRRDGANLYATVHIPLSQAIAGFVHEMKDLGGTALRISRTEVTQPGHVEAVPGAGLPVFNGGSSRGTLYVEFRVVLPPKPSPALLKLARENLDESRDEL